MQAARRRTGTPARRTGRKLNDRDPIRSGALTQAGEDLQPGVAVGWRDADLALKILHRQHGGVADAPVSAASVEAGSRKTLLDLLDFRQGEGAFGAGKRLDKRSGAGDAVAEMNDGERVVHRGIVAAYGIEIGSEQEGGSPRHRHPDARARIG